MRYILFLLVIFSLAGCAESDEGEDDPSPEVIRMPEECVGSDEPVLDECCEVVCKEYCEEEGFVYFNSESTPINCPCWCSVG